MSIQKVELMAAKKEIMLEVMIMMTVTMAVMTDVA